MRRVAAWPSWAVVTAKAKGGRQLWFLVGSELLAGSGRPGQASVGPAGKLEIINYLKSVRIFVTPNILTKFEFMFNWVKKKEGNCNNR